MILYNHYIFRNLVYSYFKCLKKYKSNLSKPDYCASLSPNGPIPGKEPKRVTGDECFSHIKDGANVFVHGGSATPTILIEKFYNYVMKNNIKNIQLFHIHTEGHFPFINPDCQNNFRTHSLFTGGNCREAINSGRGDYMPIFLSQIPKLFRQRFINLDMALISVAPPDQHSFYSLGTSVDITPAAIHNAKCVVGQINDQLPQTRGDGNFHESRIDFLIEGSMPLHELPVRKTSSAELSIGKLIAENLVFDGATLQTGIGSIPDAVLALLGNHKHLGVHTEMFSDGLIELVKKGVVTNALKKHRPGRIVSSFVIGTKKVFDFCNDNAYLEMRDIAWVNDPRVISENNRPTAINSCIEVDLTGQVVSDSIGTRIYSGFGGQVDFITGASISVDGLGKPIIALPSTTKKGGSKIVPQIRPGAGVVTSRALVHYVVTEHGIAYLFGKNIRQRAYALIQIAHPDHRESLEKAAFANLKTMPSPN